MTDLPPITQRGGVVTIQGDVLPLAYRGCLALLERHRRDGIMSPPLLHTLRAVFYRAMSPQRHPLDETPPTESPCTCHDSAYVDSAAAAELLGLSRRSVQRLAANGLNAIRCGSIWLFDRGAVVALAEQRKAAR